MSGIPRPFRRICSKTNPAETPSMSARERTRRMTSGDIRQGGRSAFEGSIWDVQIYDHELTEEEASR